MKTLLLSLTLVLTFNSKVSYAVLEDDESVRDVSQCLKEIFVKNKSCDNQYTAAYIVGFYEAAVWTDLHCPQGERMIDDLVDIARTYVTKTEEFMRDDAERTYDSGAMLWFTMKITDSCSK